MTDRIQEHAAAQPYLQGHHHYDCKTIEGDVTLREFLAGVLNYNPAWIKFLYRVRAVFVRLLGMRQDGMPDSLAMQPQDVVFEPGKYTTFFKVEAAEEDHYWIASASDSHLNAYLVVLVESLGDGRNRFSLATIVCYNNWAGPIYFNVIRPFHHVVVKAMMKAGVNDRSGQDHQKGITYA